MFLTLLGEIVGGQGGGGIDMAFPRVIEDMYILFILTLLGHFH